MPPLPDELPTLSNGAGTTHVLVPTSQVVQWSAAQAYALLSDAVREDPTQAAALCALAAERGCDETEIDAALRFVAELLGSGALVAIDVPRRPSGLRPLLRPGAAVETDDVRPLSQLVEERTSWVSIEVVDHTGVPYAELALTLVMPDGERRSIRLDRAGRHRAEEVSDPGTVMIVWPEKLELPKDAAGMDGFVARGDDVAIPRNAIAVGPRPLRLAKHHRFVVMPPPSHPTISYPSSIFAIESALPTAAIGDITKVAQESADRDPSVRFAIFGHTDLRDDADANKLLADRRARAVFGVLTGDWDEFRAAVEDEPLELAAYQMMLRVLGCNPTAIDGEGGAQTSIAIASFRRAYNTDVWHDEGRARAYGDLPEGDTLDDATKHAIVDAYHAELAGKLDAARFVGPKHVGCGEFNPLGASDAENRRVTLTVFGQGAPKDEEFPCVHGDAGACQIEGSGTFKCRFYRERIAEKDIEHELSAFWDSDWMRTTTGKTHLSALTHLPDCNDVKFVVRVVEGGRQPEDDDGRGPAPAHGEVVAELKGLVRAGVAYALWDHGEGYDPLDQEQWFRRPWETDADNLWLAAYRPPVFSIECGGFWGFSGGPGIGVSRVAEKLEGEGRAAAVLADGRIVLVDRGALGTKSAMKVTAAVIPGMRVKRDA
jgi:hypothetical protein